MAPFNEIALISGATSGFGREFVKIFAQNKYNLILVARDEGKLKKVADEVSKNYPSCKVTVVAKDLSKPGSAQELYDEVKAQKLVVDVLVNDAGFGDRVNFADANLEKELAMIQLNVTSLVQLTKLFLDDMIRRNQGKILQLASTVSFMPVPKMAVYAATKAFVLSFSEALHYELKDTHITVTALCPGASDTEFFDRANGENARIVKDTELDDPASVAQDGFDALMQGEKRVVSGAKNKMQAFMSNFVPDSLLLAGMSKMMEDK